MYTDCVGIRTETKIHNSQNLGESFYRLQLFPRKAHKGYSKKKEKKKSTFLGKKNATFTVRRFYNFPETELKILIK